MPWYLFNIPRRHPGHTRVAMVYYSRFQVTFQSPVPKFVLNIPNYITKFGILCGFAKPNLHVVNEVPNCRTKVLKYRTKVQGPVV